MVCKIDDGCIFPSCQFPFLYICLTKITAKVGSKLALLALLTSMGDANHSISGGTCGGLPTVPTGAIKKIPHVNYFKCFKH